MSNQPRTAQQCDFSMAHYGEILDRALELGYGIFPLSSAVGESAAEKGSRSILLRHDADVSLELAVQMAEFESQKSIRATYFIRLHARYYDVKDPRNRGSIVRLRHIGEVGLHYEPGFYQEAGGDRLGLLAEDRQRFASLVGTDVFGCAAHMPGTVGHFPEDEVKSAGLVYEAYAPLFTKDRKYLSDSGARWREGCLCRWLGKEDHFTVLVHPVWWLNWKEPATTVIQRLKAGD